MNKFSKFALLATSVAALCVQSASAASSYDPGDLIIGFRANGTGANPGNTDQTYAIEIGAATTYRDATGGITVVANIAADLTAAFGANWATRSDLFWGIVGNFTNAPSGPVTDGDPVRTIYASQDQTTLGTQSANPNIASSTTRASVATNITGYGNAFDAAASASNPSGSIVPTSAANDYSEYGTDSLDFNSTFGFNGIEGNSAAGITETALDLYRILYTGGSSTYEGTFVLAANGDISFRLTAAPEAPVLPEPVSTGILTSCVFVGLAGLARRKNATVQA